MDEKIQLGRDFLKSHWNWEEEAKTDEEKKVPMPPFEDPFDGRQLIALPDPRAVPLVNRDIVDVLAQRKSCRKLSGGNLSMGELSFILWAVQGVRELKKRIFRTVPSGGARHPFETYLYAERVDGLPEGLYRYIATENSLVLVSQEEGLQRKLQQSLAGQWFGCALALFWVVNAYRAEWRYAHHSHKIIALDLGHVGQNGYLAAEALGIGCCVIGAYIQEELDALLGVDGDNEFACYAALFGPAKE